jgi:hypothetical protein
VAVPRIDSPNSRPLHFYAPIRPRSVASVNIGPPTPFQFPSQKYKMLLFRQPGYNPLLAFRTNLDISAEIVRAVKGDALIHGPNMAARLVGSDWRTRRPSQLIQTYC